MTNMTTSKMTVSDMHYRKQKVQCPSSTTLKNKSTLVGASQLNYLNS